MFVLRVFLAPQAGVKGMADQHKTGVLYICPTPIGNLEDITLRALRVLREVDLIAAEDTRRTRKLLSHYDIHTSLTSYHEHSRRSKGDYLLDRLCRGESVALVSDAGTPGISDPGEELVSAALDRGVPVISLPGPSALLTALTVSGLPLARFAFEGFLPVKNKERRQRLAALAGETRTIILYESPHRLCRTLDELAKVLGGNRPACAARELTKLHEEVRRGTLDELREHFSNRAPQGEFVLVVEGGAKTGPDSLQVEQAHLSPEEHVRLLRNEGLPPSQAVKTVARLRNIPRRELYKRFNKLNDTDT
jgi:16S rRNA (cytidine1402-2'-O)-methyltransferase